MTKDEFIATIQELGTMEDETERRTKLANLSTNITELFDNYASLEEEKTKLTDANEKLRQANLDLFTQVGTSKNKSDSDIIESEDNQPKEKPKFEDLFDEKGMIK